MPSARVRIATAANDGLLRSRRRPMRVSRRRLLMITPSLTVCSRSRPLQQEARMTGYFRTTVLAAVAALAFAAPALAGPPLLCHAYDIGAAKSLPWVGERSWFEGRPDYNIQNLVADTETLLTPSAPVIVRMETLRRAAIYASTDPKIANALLKRFISRAEASEEMG